MKKEGEKSVQFRLFQEENPDIENADALSRLKQTGLPAKRVRGGKEMIIARRKDREAVKKEIKAVKKKLGEISAAQDKEHQKFMLDKRIADLP